MQFNFKNLRFSKVLKKLGLVLRKKITRVGGKITEINKTNFKTTLISRTRIGYYRSGFLRGVK